MTRLVNTFHSHDQLRTALIITRDTGYRVICLESYFGKEEEHYFEVLKEAENFAEEWVR